MHSPPTALRKQSPRRRVRPRVHYRSARPRRRIRLRTLAILSTGLGIAVIFLWAAIARLVAPTGNAGTARVDAIIVLGAKVDSDGNPTPALQARVAEGVREYERGVAPRLLLSGGMDHGQVVQANAMARVAQAQGVPPSAIVLEPAAEDTIQNACFSEHIMKQRGWTSAEVVTSSSHLPRANLIFSSFPLKWRGHAAPPIEPPSPFTTRWASTVEILKTARYLVYAQWADRCTP